MLHHFFAGPSLAGLAIVFVLLFEKEEYFHSTSHVEPAVNRQPGFRRELVEQKPAIFIHQFKIHLYMHAMINFQMELNFRKFSENT